MNKSLQDGDWDTNKASEQTVAPVYLRSEIFKNEIKEAEMMKYKLENKVILIFFFFFFNVKKPDSKFRNCVHKTYRVAQQ